MAPRKRYKRKRPYARRLPRGYRGLRGLRGYVRKSGLYGRFNVSTRAPPRGFTQELKYFDYTFGRNLVGGTSGLAHADTRLCDALLPRVLQGAGESQRIGRKIVIKSVYLNCYISVVPTVANSLPHVRFIGAWDKQTNGAFASMADILEGTSFTGTDDAPTTTTANLLFQSKRRLENQQRFALMFDDTFCFQPTERVSWSNEVPVASGTNSTVTYAPVCRHLKLYKKTNICIEYDTANANTLDFRTNSFMLYAIMDVITSPASVIRGTIRFRYSG